MKKSSSFYYHFIHIVSSKVQFNYVASLNKPCILIPILGMGHFLNLAIASDTKFRPTSDFSEFSVGSTGTL